MKEIEDNRNNEIGRKDKNCKIVEDSFPNVIELILS